MTKRIILFAVIIMSAGALNAQTIMNIYQNTGTVVQIPLNSIDSITYTILSPSNLPTLTTLPITNITSNTASSGGNITNDGGTPITQRGLVWSTTPNPTTANNLTSEGSGTGSFSSNLTGLTASTTYYMRAYATNSNGTSYGNELSFIPSASGNIISNLGAGVTFNGYNYLSIVLGNGQEWMSENLRTTVYANGDTIPNVTNATEWSNLTTGAWCHYNNFSGSENPYGKLYNWYTVNDSRNVCPTGWRVPSNTEWTVLRNYLGVDSVAGGKMKSTGTQYWSTPNIYATNETGFSSLPGGVRNTVGIFEGSGIMSYYWNSQELDAYFAMGYDQRYDTGNFGGNYMRKGYGYSVRCIKD